MSCSAAAASRQLPQFPSVDPGVQMPRFTGFKQALAKDTACNEGREEQMTAVRYRLNTDGRHLLILDSALL
jgi:hypothetical protein